MTVRLAPSADVDDRATALEPDVIHAHDFRAIGVAVRAKWRAQAAGRRVGVVYDAHEHVPGLIRNKEFVLSNDAHVAEYIPHVDAVVTVSSQLADELKRHYRLQTIPSVVLNVPMADVDPPWPVPDIRERLGLAADVPLIVHSGSIAPERGIGLVVRALPHIPELPGRPTSAAQTTLSRIMTTLDANLLGAVHGGVIMKMVDDVAGAVAQRHSAGPAVMASGRDGLPRAPFAHAHACRAMLAGPKPTPGALDIGCMGRTGRSNVSGQGALRHRTDAVRAQEIPVHSRERLGGDLVQSPLTVEGLDYGHPTSEPVPKTVCHGSVVGDDPPRVSGVLVLQLSARGDLARARTNACRYRSQILRRVVQPWHFSALQAGLAHWPWLQHGGRAGHARG
jgi:hypothetical protein